MPIIPTTPVDSRARDDGSGVVAGVKVVVRVQSKLRVLHGGSVVYP
jgi:hypothetical protein